MNPQPDDGLLDAVALLTATLDRDTEAIGAILIDADPVALLAALAAMHLRLVRELTPDPRRYLQHCRDWLLDSGDGRC